MTPPFFSTEAAGFSLTLFEIQLKIFLNKINLYFWNLQHLLLELFDTDRSQIFVTDRSQILSLTEVRFLSLTGVRF